MKSITKKEQLRLDNEAKLAGYKRGAVPSVDRNSWATPQPFFDALHAEYRFTVDAAASADNAKLPRYWDKAANGLRQDWTGERVWCNPPYGRGEIEPWVQKALTGGAELVVLLLPSRTDTPWFQDLWWAAETDRHRVQIRFLPKRIHFVAPAGAKISSPTEGNILVVVRGAP